MFRPLIYLRFATFPPPADSVPVWFRGRRGGGVRACLHRSCTPRVGNLYSLTRTPDGQGGSRYRMQVSRGTKGFVGFNHIKDLWSCLLVEMSCLVRRTLTCYFHFALVNLSSVVVHLSVPGRQCACLVPRPRGGLVLEFVSTDPVLPWWETGIL